MFGFAVFMLVALALLLLHLPNKEYISTKIMMVDKHPPPSFLAPQAAINPLKKLFIIVIYWLTIQV